MKKSVKQLKLEERILKELSDKSKTAAELLFNDREVQAVQEYANIVSIKRLGYNDHGPVHMRKSALNALIMLNLLNDANIALSLENEKLGDLEDSKLVVFTAALLHDIGMSVTRDQHEYMSIVLAQPIVDRLLSEVYKEDAEKRIILKSIILEGIFGHMATQTVFSLEAGLVLVGDGCDMENGRARIPQLLSTTPKIGDIHRYSSMAIQNVKFLKGKHKPIRIQIEMSEKVGFFQVEEVLYPKIASSPINPYIELYAGLKNQELLRYL